MRPPARNAELALLLEVAATPKPGNVDRARDHDDLRFEHFLAGAVGAGPGLALAETGEPVGRSFERAVAGMAEQRGGNTQFGALLALVPLVATVATGDLTRERADALVRETTVADAAAFYRAFEHVDVAVDDPPEGLEPLDVRRGSDAVPAIEERELTLFDVMDRSADLDGIAAEWTAGFERTFAVAESVREDGGPVPDRAARAFLEQLATVPDTFVIKRHDRETAREVCRRARAVRDGDEDADALAEDLVDRGVNPGTTADLIAAGLFVALERGVEV